MSAGRKTLTAYNDLAAPTNGSDQTTPFKRATFVFVTSDKTSSASLVVKVQGKNLDNTYFDVPGAATAAITTATTTVLIVGPGVTASANAQVAVPLPPVYRLVFTISGGTFDVATSVNYSA